MKWTKEDMASQSGRTVLVTGANSGIGYEIALAFYQKGAQVILAARDAQRLNKAMAAMEEMGGTGKIECSVLDLSSLQQIADFCTGLVSEHARLDLLINNAGVMTPPESLTMDGFELQFGVNFLGHFALTGLLYPLLCRTTGSRVVTLGSGAHKLVDHIDFENLKSEHSYDPQREYAISKLAGLQFMLELQRRVPDYPISVGAHPGVTESNLSRFMKKEDYQQAIKQYGPLMPAWQGALPALYAATAPEVKGGDYYGPDGENELNGYPAPAVLSRSSMDKLQAKKLWEFAQRATGLIFP